ncbi:MAG: phosphoribosylformylglycinamidine synthase, partial [Lachnospiraceae bacterium]|nr:phosphoribosylformylglycinamidine synthase [Lachnospiraceae bacterium]
GRVFSVEYLPGQFDQRADSAEQCIRLLKEDEETVIHTATTYVVEGNISDEDFKAIKKYCINPVDSRVASEDKPDTLIDVFPEPDDVAVLTGFISLDEGRLKEQYDSFNLAMTFKDYLHIQNYFKNEEKRDPTMTEIRVLDTYWSDHCRHTTFSTELKNISFDEGFYKAPMEETFNEYKDNFKILYKGRDDKFVCLMDLAILAVKQLKAAGKLTDQEETDEINACSIVVPIDVDGETEEWLINFKNETHNHPTEIEPFGGAATCLGGAIRDPLSGRTYVYQAMRVTGAADPTVSVKETMEGKLPQKKLVQDAAKGYSSYGNQIGLSTGYVKEIYHPDYVAKRMEIGAVMGAAPRRAVQRLTSDPGDRIILLGGRTGRDGIGGATGSSKAHNTQSTELCGAEVQKGNAPTERKLQRLFRREEVSAIIKKCNDFGAGGVSVAIGELAEGLRVNLDLVPKKYAGLDGTELAISESQERMAVVVSPKDVDLFLKYAAEENLEATEVAEVTKEPRLVLMWRDKAIVDLSRAFLDTNGAHQETNVKVSMPSEKEDYFNKIAVKKVEEAVSKGDYEKAIKDLLSDLNVCSEKGLVERFDGSIGASSVFMPFGGKYQTTETQTMVAKVPVLRSASGKTPAHTDAVTMMAYGFDPYLSSWSPFHGAQFAVIESAARIVASGGDLNKLHFTFQEYFKRMTGDEYGWGQPFSALLGAYRAQIKLGLASIGGKDSMSGSFNEINVPPTLVSFAVAVGKEDEVITPELKEKGNAVIVFKAPRDRYDLPDYEKSIILYGLIHEAILNKDIISAYSIDCYGLAAAVTKMAFGNRLGVEFRDSVSDRTMFYPAVGSIVAEVPAVKLAVIKGMLKDNGMEDMMEDVATVTGDPVIKIKGTEISLADAESAWQAPLEKVFPSVAESENKAVESSLYEEKNIYVCKEKIARPKVFIPVFPGTNCEYDSARAFMEAGADVQTKVFKNMSAADIRDSVDAFVKAIDSSQIIMFPGGFSAGDEPEGSAKFFASAFRNEKMKEAVMRLLNERDGLMLGICNGFQALIKLGLVPYGEIHTQADTAPTLTYNTIGRHISTMVYTKVVSNKSPWLMNAELGKTYVSPASHGEGRFVAPKECIEELFKNGQVCTQYADPEGNVSMDGHFNVNGSFAAIEGITSPDGRILGKMAHAERRGDHVAINIYGDQDLQIFRSGVEYFK